MEERFQQYSRKSKKIKAEGIKPPQRRFDNRAGFEAKFGVFKRENATIRGGSPKDYLDMED